MLAREARLIDMRASPYDLRDYGLDPIRIESREGREEYVKRQRDLTHNGEPILRASLPNTDDCWRFEPTMRSPALPNR